MYYDHYIWAFGVNEEHCIPTSSIPPSHPSFDTVADMMKTNFVEAPQTYAEAKKNALIRDGYRCAVTGIYDDYSVRDNRELEEVVNSDPNSQVAPTECAHIFSESTNSDSSIVLDSDQCNYAASIFMWAVMTHFGRDKLPTELTGSRVYCLENVMILIHDFRTLFDEMSVWFVATDEKNKYKLEATRQYFLRPYPEYITFMTRDEALPVPSPTYLAIHAACARVAHLSGAADCSASVEILEGAILIGPMLELCGTMERTWNIE